MRIIEDDVRLGLRINRQRELWTMGSYEAEPSRLAALPMSEQGLRG
jgi:hypothetical protein